MAELLLQVAVAPFLVAAATLASRRWGERTGGVVSAFPAIVGPVLLIEADAHGAAFAAEAATGTLLGLVALSAFALVYGLTAVRAGWRPSLLAAWAGAAAAALALSGAAAAPLAALAGAAGALALAHRALPRRAADRVAALPAPRWDLPTRMALTVLLVVALAAAAGAVGPTVGGILAALPVLASILAVFTHRQQGGAAAAELLRGMLSGLSGFAAFCFVIALLVEPAGTAAAFAAATGVALAVQAAALAATTTKLPGGHGSFAARTIPAPGAKPLPFPPAR